VNFPFPPTNPLIHWPLIRFLPQSSGTSKSLSTGLMGIMKEVGGCVQDSGQACISVTASPVLGLAISMLHKIDL